MDRPRDWDSTASYRSFKRLPAGNYICTIKGVELTKSKAGNEMLKIALDIAPEEHDFAGYFKTRFDSDSRPDKRWPAAAVVNQLTTDKEGGTNPGFKTFVESVERSNTGFTTQWGAAFCTQFRGKKIVGRFREEEYRKQNGDVADTTKCSGFAATPDIDTLDILNPKKLDDESLSSDRYAPPAYTDRDAPPENDNVPF